MDLPEFGQTGFEADVSEVGSIGSDRNGGEDLSAGLKNKTRRC